MRVLVTGSSGSVGRQIVSDLATHNHSVVEYDLAKGQDILDLVALLDAAHGCEVVIHAAALLGLPGQNDHDIMAVNLQGTWNVLSAAQEAGIPRVVFLSSVDTLGVFKGERVPDYLPLDDTHPCYPTTPYAISKYLAEAMCHFFSASTDVSVVCLRPPGVWTKQMSKGGHNLAFKPTTDASVLPSSHAGSTLLRVIVMPLVCCGLAYPLGRSQ